MGHHLPVWWNWQTRRTQNPKVAIPCRFDPDYRHQKRRYFDSVFFHYRFIVNFIQKREIGVLCRKKLDMVSVAKELGYSKSHFSRAINKPTGLSFNALVAMIRVESAKKLIRDTGKTILEIVIECGFGSERSFYRQFSSTVGQSPLQYRKSVLQDK